MTGKSAVVTSFSLGFPRLRPSSPLPERLASAGSPTSQPSRITGNGQTKSTHLNPQESKCTFVPKFGFPSPVIMEGGNVPPGQSRFIPSGRSFEPVRCKPFIDHRTTALAPTADPSGISVRPVGSNIRAVIEKLDAKLAPRAMTNMVSLGNDTTTPCTPVRGWLPS
jgi:hypothetical protein